MARFAVCLCVVFLGTALLAVPGAAGPPASPWPQFRGPNGSGVCESCRPPVRFGPDANLLWKAAVPPGHSSPILSRDHVFLTAHDGGRLWTLALNARDGRERWRREAPMETLEKVHPFNSPASPTPATDGERVYVYFGSFGLLAYDLEGRERWRIPLEAPPTQYGTSSSPIAHGRNVILQRDGNSTSSELRAVDGRSGRTLWAAPRPLLKQSFSTPMIWTHAGGQDLITVGNGRVTAYDPRDGRERWWAGGVTSQPAALAVADERLIFVGSPGAGGGDVTMQSWADLVRDHDADADGRLALGEVPESAGVQLRPDVPRDVPGNFLSMRRILTMADQNKDGVCTREEWDGLGAYVASNQSNVLALRPGGQGEATTTHLAWKGSRGIGEMPSPLLYRGRLWMVRNGGMVTSYEPATGRVVLDRQRLGVEGQYAASPVAADGHVFAASETGTVSGFRALDTLEVVARNELGERILATPALAGETLYVRTEKHLWAFRSSKTARSASQ